VEDISAYIKKRNADFVPTYLIVRELKAKGYKEAEISAAMAPVRDVQADEKKTWKPYAITIAIFAVFAYIIGFGKTKVLLTAAIVFFLKTFLYSALLHVVLMMGKGNPKYEHCFYTGLVIAGLTFITPAYLMYFILVVTVFYMMMGFEGGNLKTYTAYMIFLIITEVMFSIISGLF